MKPRLNRDRTEGRSVFYTWAMCLAVMIWAITNDACQPCFKPKISISPSSQCASTNPLCKNEQKPQKKTISLKKLEQQAKKQKISVLNKRKTLPSLNSLVSDYPMDVFHFHNYQDSIPQWISRYMYKTKNTDCKSEW